MCMRKNINMLCILFLFNILSLIYNNLLFSYMAITILFIYILNKMDFKMNVYYFDKRILALAFIIFMHNIVITVINLNDLAINQFVMVMIWLLTILTFIFIISFEKTIYIEDGLKLINKILFLINMYGIIEFITKGNMFTKFIIKNYSAHLIGTDNYRTASFFLHPIIYSNILLICFWINMYYSKNSKFRVLNSIVILINIYATKSRSSWIALLITFTVYLIVKINRNMILKKNISLLNTLCILGIILVIIMISRFTIFSDIYGYIIERFQELNSHNGSISAMQRLGSLEFIFNKVQNEQILNLIFGNGCGSSSKLMSTSTIVLEGFKTTDNQYISIIWENGILGLLMNLTYLIISIYRIFTTDNKLINTMSMVFLSISIMMFFYEAYGWYIITQIYILSIVVISVKEEVSMKGEKYEQIS